MFERAEHMAGIIKKHLQGTLSSEEKAQLDTWMASSSDNRLLVEEATQQDQLEKDIHELYSIDKEAGWRNISQQLQLPRIIPYRRWLLYAVAASVIMVAGVVTYRQRTSATEPLTADARFHNDVQPGNTNNAVLMLSNGQRINLNNAQQGLLAHEGLADVKKQSDGQLIYTATNKPQKAVGYNTLTTPNGGSFQLTLPDGTRVWLNNTSTLKYPTAFVNNERVVELTGEAYFEVNSLPVRNGQTMSKRPFIVKAGALDVQVQGTHFTVLNYADEQTAKVTLLEGKVQVQATAGNHASAVLAPGQQAQLTTASNHLRVKEQVNTEEAIAFTQGIFHLDNTDIETLMRQVSRWYGVTVVYKGKPVTQRFNGTIPRSTTLIQLCQVLEELTDNVHFAIEGQQLTVMP